MTKASRRTLALARTCLMLLGTLPACAAAPQAPGVFIDVDPAKSTALCRRYASAEPPASDRPTAAQRQSLGHCDGEALLYGIGRPADPVRARLCAFVQRDDPASKGELSGLFDGNGLLMTIYANGLGVIRNQPVAIRLACDAVESAESEIEFRVPHLAGTLHEPSYTATFSPCDDITSGRQQGACALHAARLAGAGEARTIDAYASHLPERARRSFAALRAAQAAWALARGGGEVELTGSGRAAYEIEEEGLQNADFVAMLTRLRSAQPPHTGASQLKTAQLRINAVLPKLLNRPVSDLPGAITSGGIRKAQAAWTAYRDAWGAFAAEAYPAWGANGAEAWVTMKRADMLAHMLAETD